MRLFSIATFIGLATLTHVVALKIEKRDAHIQRSVCPDGDVSCAPTSCSPGQYPSKGSCSPCPAGTYSEAGAPSCSTCPANTYSTGGTTACTDCPAGWTADAGSAKCKSYCGAGEFPHGPPCYFCTPGTYSEAGDADCTDCPADTYSAYHAGSCTPCPPGKGSPPRSGSVNQCTDKCPGGSVPSPNGQTCTPCPANTYSDGDHCTPCSYGSTSNPGSSRCGPQPSKRAQPIFTQKICAGEGDMYCPILFGAGGMECVNTLTTMDSCGGCVGPEGEEGFTGRDCSAIPNVSSVACEAGLCKISSCIAGYKARGWFCVPVENDWPVRHPKRAMLGHN